MGVTQYVGARYVPIFAEPAEWTKTRTYEPLTIVLHNGNSFTSKQFVPKGIDINNDDFWAETGNYNAQVEAYRQEVLRFMQDVSYLDIQASKIYDNVSEMLNDDKIKEGNILRCLSQRTKNDMGGAYYVAKAEKPDSFYLESNGLFLQLLSATTTVNPVMFGAVGDGITDDSNALIEACKYPTVDLLGNEYYMKNATVLIESPCTISNGTIYTSGAKAQQDVWSDRFRFYATADFVMQNINFIYRKGLQRPIINEFIGGENCNITIKDSYFYAPDDTYEKGIVFVHATSLNGLLVENCRMKNEFTGIAGTVYHDAMNHDCEYCIIRNSTLEVAGVDEIVAIWGQKAYNEILIENNILKCNSKASKPCSYVLHLYTKIDQIFADIDGKDGNTIIRNNTVECTENMNCRNIIRTSRGGSIIGNHVKAMGIISADLSSPILTDNPKGSSPVIIENNIIELIGSPSVSIVRGYLHKLNEDYTFKNNEFIIESSTPSENVQFNLFNGYHENLIADNNTFTFNENSWLNIQAQNLKNLWFNENVIDCRQVQVRASENVYVTNNRMNKPNNTSFAFQVFTSSASYYIVNNILNNIRFGTKAAKAIIFGNNAIINTQNNGEMTSQTYQYIASDGYAYNNHGANQYTPYEGKFTA